jgi:GH25 family lysozyme M1 (1,4-beta-N-acetylmuramidase)
MIARCIYAMIACSMTLVPNAAFAQLGDADDINPSEVRRDWLFGEELNELTPDGAGALAKPYVLNDQERTKFPHAFGVNFSHYDFDIDASRNVCRTQDGYEKPECSCTIDWKILQSNKILFTYSKASDGETIDLSFRRYWKELEQLHKDKKIYRGGYHFLRASPSAEKQAATFLKAIGAVNGAKPLQLPPILDVEWMNRRIEEGTTEFDQCPPERRTKRDDGTYLCDMWYKTKPADIVAMATTWINIVEKATGRPVAIYTNVTGWWNSRLGAEGKKLAAKQAFWLSRYTTNGPTYVDKWTNQGGSPKWGMPMLPVGTAYNNAAYDRAHFWQFTEDGRLPDKFYTCKGKLIPKPMELNYMPVSGPAFDKLMLGP